MLKFVIPILKWIIAYFFSCHSKKKVDARNIMLISEKGNDARDNGFHFFKYVKATHPEIRAYYVIASDSFDRHRLDEYGDCVVDYLSYRNCKLFWQAKYLVSTHLRAGHTPMPYALSKWINRFFNIYKGKIVVNIKHGIVKSAPTGLMERMIYENTQYDFIACGAKPEWEFLISAYHYPESVAKYTGLCRFDQLCEFRTKRQILIMPTWRRYLNEHNLKDSFYVKAYVDLLCDVRLSELLEKYDVNLMFYPHHVFQSYLDLFYQGNLTQRIKVADQKCFDVQQLLKESAVMITDYSSVLFDFVYMKKPVLFYQFDREEYYKSHLAEGYFHESSFGPVCTDSNSLVNELSVCLSQGMSMDSRYETVVDRFFPIRDANNCSRVYNAIMDCV